MQLESSPPVLRESCALSFSHDILYLLDGRTLHLYRCWLRCVQVAPALYQQANSPAPPRMLLLPLQDVLGFSQTGGKQLEVGRYC